MAEGALVGAVLAFEPYEGFCVRFTGCGAADGAVARQPAGVALDDEGGHRSPPASAAAGSAARSCSPMNWVYTGGMACDISSRFIQSMPSASAASTGVAL